MAKKARLLLLLSAVILCGCSVAIYDLQPIIVGTDTPVPVLGTKAAYRGVTPSPYVREASPTPPIHIAPTQIMSAVAVNVLDLAMMDGATGWAVGQIPGAQDKMVVRTTDGGETWRNVTPPQAIYENTDLTLEVIASFRDANHAWVIFTEGGTFQPQKGISVWYTADGGAQWESTKLPVNGYPIQVFDNAKITFLDNQTGWITAKLGSNDMREFFGLYTTRDGGASWNAMVTSDTENLPPAAVKNGAVFRSMLDGWVSGKNTAEDPGAVLWNTFDGGNSWYSQTLPAPQGLDIPQGLLTDPEYSCSFSVPKFVDTQYLYAWAVLKCTGKELTEPVSILYRTEDGLTTWSTVRLPAAEGNLVFYGSQYGWYSVRAAAGSGYSYEILFTEDGGTTWTTASTPAWDSRLQFITPVVGFGIATYNGMPALIKTGNSGVSWEQIIPMVMP